ncbi:MAG: carbohydrate ABC transporter permease, partial [Bacteroidota bacterium]
MKSKHSTIAFGFLAPWVMKLCIFWLYPLVYALYMSFTRYRALGNTSEFIGFDNYTSIGIDPLFWKALTNTIVYAFGAVPLSTIAALFLAVLLHSKLASY